jgi:hypothetical protein
VASWFETREDALLTMRGLKGSWTSSWGAAFRPHLEG